MAQSLYRSLLEAPENGGALPQPFGALEVAGVAFRRGQVAIVAAAPGGGKTALITNYCIAQPVREQVSILYLSPDSDIMTIGPRIIASLTARETRNVLRDFGAKGEAYNQHLESSKQLSHIQWCFQASPTYEDIEAELTGYVAVHGHMPDLIILDNIRDVYAETVGDGGEHQRHSATVDYFHELARVTNSAVVLLHHLTGVYEDSTLAPPLSALLGKIGKQARLVLNLFQPEEGTLGAVVAKNSNGRAFPGASEYLTMTWDKEVQLIS